MTEDSWRDYRDLLFKYDLDFTDFIGILDVYENEDGLRVVTRVPSSELIPPKATKSKHFVSISDAFGERWFTFHKNERED